MLEERKTSREAEGSAEGPEGPGVGGVGMDCVPTHSEIFKILTKGTFIPGSKCENAQLELKCNIFAYKSSTFSYKNPD